MSGAAARTGEGEKERNKNYINNKIQEGPNGKCNNKWCIIECNIINTKAKDRSINVEGG